MIKPSKGLTQKQPINCHAVTGVIPAGYHSLDNTSLLIPEMDLMDIVYQLQGQIGKE